MRTLVSILLICCFVSVSALASHDHADAGVPAMDAQITESVAIDAATLSADAEMDLGDGKKECPCEKKADSLNLTCGVTLALSGDAAGSCLTGAKQAWFLLGNDNRNRQMTYLLKRPPRTVL